MKITILTLFPDIVESFFRNSIMEKAVNKNIIEYNIVNFRDFAFDRHKTCDDAPYGGGAGMVLKAEPLALALDTVVSSQSKVILPTPSGIPLTQSLAYELAEHEELVFICGRYEGIDQRIIDTYVDQEITIGDYVISSGEIASLVIIDSVYRLIDGVISKESLAEESFSDNLLEYPQYTRPEEFRGLKVPPILLSGNHAEIDKWRKEKRIEKTIKNRPELLAEKRKTV
ncbi:MAG: tRNA (guanosine(37)-N1)-methyltransferase TrmD [Spirochaetales bacterium]|nr:tRNA (guanosine(37)-N1)-methyltransferase TrmD [Spirochaetales bacterium]